MALTEKQIEALEYCLIKLNTSLATPTAETLLPQDLVSPRLSQRMAACQYYMTMQDVTFVGAYVLSVDPAEYTQSMQSADFVHGVYTSFSVDPATYVLTMQEVTLTLTLVQIDIEMSLDGSYDNQTFRGLFSLAGTGTYKYLFVSGDPKDDFTADTRDYSATINVIVKKLTNGGITLGEGEIIFRRTPFGESEVTEPGSGVIGSGLGTQEFVAGQNIGTGGSAILVSYNFTGLADDDTISVYVRELPGGPGTPGGGGVTPGGGPGQGN